MALPVLFAALLVYLLAARLVLRLLSGTLREAGFALLNLAGLYWFLCYHQSDHFRLAFVIYCGVVLWQYVMLWLFSEQAGWKPWLAFFAPVSVLIIIRYVPLGLPSAAKGLLATHLEFPLAVYFVGLSYLAFRSSQLVLEIRNGVVKKPSLWQYLGFCFFVPTMTVGPINPYSNFRRAFAAEPPAIPVGRAALRILVGAVKYQFFGSLCNRLTYDGLLLDSHPHHLIDFPVAVFFYYLYLYCNFSGYCDMAIGAAGLIGVPVAENFDNPFAARNVKDFWNRWHITLSIYMRDVVFSPLSKFLVRVMGPARANHAIALTITVVFLLVGIWHGVGWNYAAFGAAHALGVVVNHYYTIILKKRLGREGFKAYTENRWIHAVAVMLTFCYVAASLMFFANTFPEMKQIFASLR
jgi:D-alanyl-lipoteichoic acid acyltransferase DltB (MBOAT superfamily)